MDRVRQAQVEQDEVVTPAGKAALGVLQCPRHFKGNLEITGLTDSMLDKHRIGEIVFHMQNAQSLVAHNFLPTLIFYAGCVIEPFTKTRKCDQKPSGRD